MELTAKHNTLSVPKGYKQTEVGVIPEDWEVKELGELAEKIVGGGTPSRSNQLFWGNSNEIPWVTVKDFATFSSFKSQEYITKEGLKNSSANLIPKGNIITSTRMAIGKAVIYDVDVSINQDLKALYLKNNIDVKFFYYWFEFNSKYIEDLGSGSTVMGISLIDLKKIKIPLPPKPEQKAIAQVLSDTDALLQALEKKIAKKKSIKKGVMQELLKPKEGWVTIPLPEAVDYIHGKAHEQDIVKTGKYVVVNSKYISRNGTVVKYSNSNFCKAKSGDILTVLSDLPNGKALAKCFYVSEDDKYAVNQRICIWRPKKDQYPMFLKYLLNRHKYFLSLDDGVTQTHILNHHIEKCEISIPSNFHEQEQIGNTLFDIDSEIQTLEQKLYKYQLAKQGMMQQLLTGKIRLVV